MQNKKHAERANAQLVVRGDKYKSTVYHCDEKCLAPQILVQFFEGKQNDDTNDMGDSVPHSKNLAMRNFHRLMFLTCAFRNLKTTPLDETFG